MKATSAGRIVHPLDEPKKKPVIEMTAGEIVERFYAWVAPIPSRVTAHERIGK